MQKIAIVVLSDTESGEGLGRIVNALTAAKEYKEAGDELSISFTGAGTKWPAALNDSAHPAHALYQAVQDRVAGACGYCANAFGQTDAVRACGMPLLEDFGQNMSFRKLTQAGYQIVTF